MPIRVAGPQRKDQRQRWNEKTTKHDWQGCSSWNANSRKLESKMQDSKPKWKTMQLVHHATAFSIWCNKRCVAVSVPSEGGGVQSTGNRPRFTKHDGLWQLTICVGERGIEWAAYTMKLLISNLPLMAIWMIVKMRSLNWISHIASSRQHFTLALDKQHQTTQVWISPPLRKVRALCAFVRKIEVESLPQHIRWGWGFGALVLHDLRTSRALIEDVKLKKFGSWHHEIGCSIPDPVDILISVMYIRSLSFLKTYSYPNSGLSSKLSNLRRTTHMSSATICSWYQNQGS